MKKNWILILIIMVVFLPLGAEPMNLTVDKAVELGLSNNFNIRVQESKVGTSARAKDDAWNVFIPDVSASAILSRSNSAMTTPAGMVISPEGASSGLSATTRLPVFDQVSVYSYDSQEMSPWTLVGNLSAQMALSPAIGNGITALALNYENALLGLESAENTTEQSIKKNFYGILLMQEQINLLKKNIKTMESRLVNMEEMYNYGYITQLDLLNTEAGLASMGPTLTSLENSYELMLMSFRMELGLDLDQPLTLDGEVEASPATWDADMLVNKYLGDSLDLKQLEISRQMLENGKNATFNQSRLPALILSWSYSPYQADPFDFDNWGEDNFSGDNGSLSITFSMPVDDWLPHSGTDNKLKEAEEQLEQLAYQRELAVLGTEMQIRSLVMNLNTSRENLAVKEDAVGINRQSYEMSQEAYNNGGLTLIDLETAENDLLQAESDLLSEKYTYISNLLDLEAALNRSLN
ncbi:MAG: TolC family protein [Spirochaetales bacterium]|nr:TolC family protein [Spirochaetales bacterium]